MSVPGIIIDLSSNNGDPTKFNWKAIKAAGVIAVFDKATQGDSYRNPYYMVNGGGARSVEIGFRAYHYAGFGNPVTEASFFRSVAGVDATILDVETSTNEAWMNSFLIALGVPIGKEMTYGSASTLPRSGLRSLLWPASYGKNYGFGDCWQYTDALTIAGIPGKVDASTWVGSSDDFNTFFGLNAPPPSPPVVAPPTEYPGDNMKSYAMSVLISGGKGDLQSLPAGVTPSQIISVTMGEIDPQTLGKYADVPAFAGVTSDSKLVFGPGPGANAANINGTYGFTLWVAD